MALEDISAAVTGFSTGMGLMNDWEKQKLAVERERRLAEQAASQEQFRRLGLTRDIIGEYREDAPAVLQATGLPVPDPGLMGVFQRATTKEQEAADYVMNPSRRGTQIPSLSPKHPLWPEVRAAMAEERKRALAEQQGQNVAQAYEQARGADQQMTVPGDMSTVERTALARARMGDRKLLDTLQEGQAAAEMQRELMRGLPEGASKLEPSYTLQGGKLTTRLASPRMGVGTETERRARLMTAQEGHEPGSPGYEQAYLENLQIARYLGSSNVNLQAIGAEALRARLSGAPMAPEQLSSAIQAATINSQVAAIRNELQAAARSDPRAPQPGTPAFAAEVDRRIQGNKEASAKAYSMGRYQGEMAQPFGLERNKYLDPRTDQPPPADMPKQMGIRLGIVEVPAKHREALASIQPAKQLAMTALDRADKLITVNVSKDPGLAGYMNTTWDVLMQRSKAELGRATSAGPEFKTFADQLDGFIGRISKAFAGEVGVLTNQDIDRVRRAFPSPFMNDTKQSATLKRELIMALIDESEKAARQVIYGGLPGTTARAESGIPDIVNQIDMAVPVGGQRGPATGGRPSPATDPRDALSQRAFGVPYNQLSPADKARVDKRVPAAPVGR